jgi:Tol biopolymer transport system component
VTARRVLRLVATIVAISAAACADGPTAPEPVYELVVEGWLERGAEVRLQVLSDGLPLPPESVAWSAEPAAAVHYLDPGHARLEAPGRVDLRAEVASRSIRRTVDVGRPPTLVFDRLYDGNRDIFRVGLDGRDLERLTVHPAQDAEPTVAHGRVVFTSFRDGGWALFSVPLEGGVVTPVTSSAGAERHPALSPDGSRVLFTREYAGVPKLVVRELDTGGEVRPTLGFGYDGALEVSPAWSRSGQKIAFVSTAQGQAGLYQIPEGSGGPEPLGPKAASGGDFDPAWSPDGRRVVFASNRSGATELYVLNTVSGATTPLTDDGGHHGQAVWLPDGRIVFTSWVDGVPRLRWLDPDHPHTLYEIPTGDGAARNPAVAVAPSS